MLHEPQALRVSRKRKQVPPRVAARAAAWPRVLLAAVLIAFACLGQGCKRSPDNKATTQALPTTQHYRGASPEVHVKGLTEEYHRLDGPEITIRGIVRVVQQDIPSPWTIRDVGEDGTTIMEHDPTQKETLKLVWLIDGGKHHVLGLVGDDRYDMLNGRRVLARGKMRGETFVAGWLTLLDGPGVVQPATQPAAAPPTKPIPPGEFMPRVEKTLKALQEAVKDDPTLGPLASAKIERNERGTSIRIEALTPQQWDFPNKGGPPTRRHHGRMMVSVVAERTEHWSVWSPFLPPPGCWAGHSILVIRDTSAGVTITSTTAEAKAHRRLVELTIAQLGKVGLAAEFKDKDGIYGFRMDSWAGPPASRPAGGPLTQPTPRMPPKPAQK